VVDEHGRSDGVDVPRERLGAGPPTRQRLTEISVRGNGVVCDHRAHTLRVHRGREYREPPPEGEADHRDAIAIDPGVALQVGEGTIDVFQDQGMIGPTVRPEIVQAEDVGRQCDVAGGRDIAGERLDVGARAIDRVKHQDAGASLAPLGDVELRGHLALAPRILDRLDADRRAWMGGHVGKQQRGSACNREDSMTKDHSITRRTMLGTVGLLGAAAVTGALAVPGPAPAQALGLQETVDDAMKRVFGSRPIKDGSSAVKLEVPLIAENGAVVPVAVDVSSPMTATSYVKHIFVIADKNRIPIVTRVALAPEAGQAYVGANIRLGESGDVRAIAELSDGTLLQVKREVKVTVGGCGG
jgi:sulfur-oxidizing protein SoxY